MVAIPQQQQDPSRYPKLMSSTPWECSALTMRIKDINNVCSLRVICGCADDIVHE